MANQSKLIEEFQSFVAQYSDGEEIDKLTLSPEQQSKKKADYFFCGREIICEQKNLEKDMREKIQAKVDEIMSREDAPAVYGTVALSEIIRAFPDSDKINRDFFEIATSSIKNLFQKANRQIRVTKETFGLSNSKGVLFVVNESAYYIEPRDIVSKISQMYSQKEGAGFRYDNIHALWLIQPSHTLSSKGVNMIPSIYLANDYLFNEEKDASEFTNKIEGLDREFAKYLGMPFGAGKGDIKNMEFEPSGEKSPLKISSSAGA